jgi:signal transduction histidine kinase
VAPQKVRFRYRLEEYDSEWINAGSRRTAYYSNVPPGKYRFRVIAANNDGVWNEKGAGISIDLHPHFYQTYWFYALCAISILFATHRIYLIRINRVKDEFAAVLEERNRIAREIHDTLAQGFAGISVQLEAGKQMLFEFPKLAEEHLDHANVLARSCLEEVRQYVWNLRHQELGKEGLAVRLSGLAQKITGGVPFHVKISGAVRQLPEHIENSLLRIGQEAIVNAVKHAKAGRIEIELIYEPSQVQLCIQDDGCGFDLHMQQSPNHGGFGLLGMTERATHAGGHLAISSSPGKGTNIEVRVPLQT